MSDTKDKKGFAEKPFWVFLLCVAVVLLVIWFYPIIYPVWVKYYLPTTWENQGLFGDSYGVVNSFFSGLAFAGLVVAILLQRKELKLQREDLNLTREEMKIRNFETTFFNMLRLYNDIVGDLVIRLHGSPNSDFQGRSVISEYMKNLKDSLSKRDVSIILAVNNTDEINSLIQKKVPDKILNLEHCVNCLCKIFELVKNEKDKRDIDEFQFVEIVTAQLSTDEMIMLFSYGLTKPRGEKLRHFIEKYHLLKDISEFPYPFNHLKKNYDDSAFEA